MKEDIKINDQIPLDSYAIIIGAMKCGTTSLFNYLEQHPQICPAKVKEPEYFSENQQHGVELGRYEDLWNFDQSVHKYVLEASSGYTKFPMEMNVPENIFNYGIKPKFIYIIRNPFERIESHYNYMQGDSSWSLDINDGHLLNTTKYFTQIKHFQPFFSADEFLMLDFTDLISEPSMVLKKIYSFLNIEIDFYPSEFGVFNETKVDSRLEKIIQQLNVGKYFPKALKDKVKESLKKISPPANRQLSDLEKEAIYNALKQDMESLRKDFDFDVSRWGF